MRLSHRSIRPVARTVSITFDGAEIPALEGETIAAALGEARDAIEDVVEPYLMQQGFVQRTPRGRVLASAAYGHLGLNAPPASPSQTGLFAEDGE